MYLVPQPASSRHAYNVPCLTTNQTYLKQYHMLAVTLVLFRRRLSCIARQRREISIYFPRFMEHFGNKSLTELSPYLAICRFSSGYEAEITKEKH